MRVFLISLLLMFSLQGHANDSILNFGVVPQQSASKLARLWTPILKAVSQHSGIKIQFTTAPDIPTFEKRLAKGEYDFAYMNPYHFTIFNRTPGYQAIARARDKKIKGIVVVSKKSSLQSIQQLDNMQLAFPAPAAFAASILPRSHLSAIGNQYQAKYVSSHDSVYRTVAKGLYPAGGGVMRTFNNLEPKIRDQLRILWTTKGYTPHAIAAHPKLNADIQNRIKKAFVGLETTATGKELLNRVKIKGFISAHNKDWDDVRALRIDLLSDLIR